MLLVTAAISPFLLSDGDVKPLESIIERRKQFLDFDRGQPFVIVIGQFSVKIAVLHLNCRPCVANQPN